MNSALSGVTTGSFDELFVRDPSLTGEYRNILELTDTATYDDTVVRSDIAYNHSSITALASNTATALDGKVANARVLTDIPAGALFTDTIYEHPTDHSVGFITGLQAALDDKVAASRVLTDVPADAKFTDKDTLYTHPSAHSIGFITGLQTALDDKVASSRVLTDVPAGAVFTDKDTLYTHPSDHSIGFITGLQTALDGKVPNSRVLTAVPVNAVFSDSVYTAPSSRPISYITGLQGALNDKAGQSATVSALSFKVDKEGSISESESHANLLARVQTAVPSGALFTDTVFNRFTDIPDGSLDILQVAGLNAALGTFQSTIGSGDLSFAMTSGLQLALNTLATDIAAIPTSQVILSNGTFVDQHRFGIDNGEVVLDLNLGWLFRATPMWSQLVRDPARILHARLGHLPLESGADTLCYFPRISGDEDMGPGALNWVTPTSDPQGDWGVFELATITSTVPATNSSYRLFPNRDVPAVQPSSRGIGWPSSSAAAFCIEFQVKLGPDTSFHMMWTPDADLDSDDLDLMTSVKLSSNGEFRAKWHHEDGDDQGITTGVVQESVWHHVAIQKPAGGDRLYWYLDGLLRYNSNVTVSPPSVIDAIHVYGTGTADWRELVIRSNCPYPTTPFVPGPVTFASVIGVGRWNSYMLE